MEYLELLGEVVGHDGREGRKERSQKDADVADVDGDVEEVEGMVQGCRGDHQTYGEGTSQGASVSNWLKWPL